MDYEELLRRSTEVQDSTKAGSNSATRWSPNERNVRTQTLCKLIIGILATVVVTTYNLVFERR